MNIDGSFKLLLQDLDLCEIQEKLNSCTDEDWNRFTLRQEIFDVASDTKTIVMKFNGPTQTSNHPSKTTTFEGWDEWKAVVEPLISKVQELYPESVISKCFLPKLKAGGSIGKHTDNGPTLQMVHRIHIPIFTNKDVIFTVDGESINMKEGCAYEINNLKEHGVVNNGDTDRVHLLFDLYVN
jgi:hypothetical protein